MNPDTGKLITEHLSSSRSSWSIGVRGAIAEFLRCEEEVTDSGDLERLEVRTPRGAIRISPCGETIEPVRYRNSLHFCLAQSHSTLSPCTEVLTELGPDQESLSSDFTQHVLFDLGLGIPHVRACVRTAEPSLLNRLRNAAGRPLLGPDPEVVRLLGASSPHRVFISNLARIEVYGPIPTEQTPDGPHTHLLPELLGSTDEALEKLIPAAHYNCLSLYFPD